MDVRNKSTMTNSSLELFTVLMNMTSEVIFDNSSTNVTTTRLMCSNHIRTILPPLRLSYQAIVFVLALLGNICVIAFIKRWKVTSSSRMYIFIVHLCVADIFVALFHILPHLIEFSTKVDYGNNGMCKLVMYGKMVPLFMSAYIMLVTAIDRYREVFHPSSQSMEENYILLFIAWFVPFIFGIPQILNFEMAERRGILRCRMTASKESFRAYLLFFNISIYIVPLFMLIFIYGRLSWVIWKKERVQQIPNATINGVRYSIQDIGGLNGLTEAKMKSIQLTLVIVIVYFICWTPFVVAHFWATYGKAPWCSVVFQMMMLTTSINSCCNPFIYLAFSSRQIQRMLPCCKNTNNYNLNYRQGLYLVKETTRQPEDTYNQESSLQCL